MSKPITITVDADDLARICRALDAAADTFLAAANRSTSAADFTLHVGEAAAMRYVRASLAERLVAGH